MTGLAIPLRVRRALRCNRDTAFTLSIPCVASPTFFAIGAFLSVPCHLRRADGTHSGLKFEEFLITNTLNTVKLAVIRAIGNWNRYNYLLADSSLNVGSESTFANAFLPIEVLVFLAFRDDHTGSLYSFTARDTEAVFSDWIIDFVLLASWRQNNFLAFTICSSDISALTNADLTIKDFMLAGLTFNTCLFI